MNQMQVVDISWHSIREDEFAVDLIGWSQEKLELNRVLLERNTEISWRIHGPRKCIGYRGPTGLERCPEETVLSGGKRRCGPCSVMDVFDPCVRCDGSDCRASQEKFSACKKTEYVVYAVLLGHRVKVGVSKKQRIMTRWVEQGADFGMTIEMVKGGDEARRIESRIGRSPDISKSVRTKSKHSDLLLRMDKDEAEEILSRFRRPDLRPEPIQDLRRYYHLSEVDRLPELITEWKSAENQVIKGMIIGVKGPILVTKLGHSYTAYDMKRVIGYRIEEDSKASIITQTGLHEFAN